MAIYSNSKKRPSFTGTLGTDSHAGGARFSVKIVTVGRGGKDDWHCIAFSRGEATMLHAQLAAFLAEPQTWPLTGL